MLEIEEELDYAPDWVCKARFRRGQAQARKRNFSMALQDFSMVLKHQPQVQKREIPFASKIKQYQAHITEDELNRLVHGENIHKIEVLALREVR